MNQTLETIHSLRSIHGNFSNKEISAEYLETILAASVRAANASARQSYSIVVLEDKDVIKEVCHYVGSKALVFCLDFTRLADIADRLGYEYGPDKEQAGIEWFIPAATDTALAAQTAAIAAKSLGIDSLFTNSILRGDISRVYQILDLPETNCFPLIALVLGYPDEEPAHQKGRLSGPGVIHRGKYSRLTTEETDAMIAEFDDPASGLSLGWNNKDHEHYLDWFFEAWSNCPRKDDTTADRPRGRGNSAQMVELLKRAGFLMAELQYFPQYPDHRDG